MAADGVHLHLGVDHHIFFLRNKLRARYYFKIIGVAQRWSRGHKARGQGHKKNPRLRPRTAFQRTEPLEAKDSNARGQGQGPRTQAQAFFKKKMVFKIFFQAISKLLAYPEFLVGGGLNQARRQDSVSGGGQK